MVDFFQLLISPENLLFLTSLLVCVALLGLQLSGFIGDTMGDVGGVLGDVLGFDGSPSIEVEGGASGVSDVANFPVVTLLILFCGAFGIVGILANVLLDEFFDLGTIIRVIIAIVLSAVISLVFARAAARTVGSWLPDVETHGLDGTNLNKCFATVVSETMTSEGLGRISVTDRKAGNYRLRGKLLEGYEAVANGEVVVVVKHDQNSDICFCVPASDWSLPEDPSD